MKETSIHIQEGRPILIVNEDNDHFFKLPSEYMTEQALTSFVDDVTCGGQVTHLFFCPFGQRPSYASDVCEPIWAGMEEPDMNGKTHNIWCVNAKLLHDRGIDPYQVWLRRSRERGVSAWLSMRMNDLHFITTKNYFRTCNFWREHPELRRTVNGPVEGDWRLWAFDYSREAVREFHFRVFKELVDRYSPDGIELDWMRFSWHLTPGKEREQSHFITDFIRQCREYTLEAGKRCGHPISLSVRVPTLPETAFGLGLDAEIWAAAGLVDLIVVTNFLAANDYTCPLEEWIWRIRQANPEVLVIPGTSNRINSTPNLPTIEIELEYLYSWASLMYAKGAQGLYLFNLEYIADEKKAVIHRLGLRRERLSDERKRFPVSYHDCVPNEADMTEAQLPRSTGQDALLRIPLSDVRMESNITLIVGFSEEGVNLPDGHVTLNGVRPEGASRKCGNPGMFGGKEVCKTAYALPFPSFAAWNGMNYVRIGKLDLEATLIWCEIIID